MGMGRGTTRRAVWGGVLGVAGLLLPFATGVQAQTKYTNERLTVLDPTRVLRADSSDAPTSVAIGGCVTDNDCDDGLGCTQNRCVSGICSVSSIPGCVACEPGHDCVPVELVFIMDTSGSMRDEATALCGQINDVVADLEDLGASVAPTLLGITNTGDISFACLEDDVVTLLGSTVPGTMDTCAFPGAESSFESWGPATAIVAANFPWTPGSTRIIVPLSDEGPCNGNRPDGCNDPGDDRDSITNAGLVAVANGVVVSPVTGTGSDACVVSLAQALASSTGGTAIQTTDAQTDMSAAITEIVLATCVADPSCDDGSVCTDDDTCIDGACVGTPNFDVVTSCCDPVSGDVETIDDEDVCTDDVCDATTGMVSHLPSDGSVSCDDGNICTVNDVCDGAGGCAGTDVNDIACASDADCFGSSCDLTSGFCVCTSTPELCLTVLDPRSGLSCHAAGDTVTVDIELGFSTNVIAGADLFFSYNPAILRFESIVPGALVDASSPYELELFREIDEVAGTVFYAVGIGLGGFGSQGPTTMARVQFTALSACQSDELCWLGGNPKRTTLSDMMGVVVPFEPCCSGDIFVNSTETSIACPSSAVLTADPGSASQTLLWNPVSASSDCQETIDVSCSAMHSNDAQIDQLIESGGLFPGGISSFSCSAVDACGVTSSCEWSVEVQAITLVEVDLELSPPMISGQDGTALERCIEFELYSNCSTAPVVVSRTVEFGPPFNLQGRAVGVTFEVPPGDYQCITARDPLHTIQSVSGLTVGNGRFQASFTGDPQFGGNWLINGNLDGNDAIDVLDFGVFVDFHNTAQAPDTPCGTSGVHADFNGDGFVDTRDWQFISDHLEMTDMVSCCQASGIAGSSTLTEISVEALIASGLGRLTIADLNRDGWVDQADVALFGADGFSPKAHLRRTRDPRRRQGE